MQNFAEVHPELLSEWSSENELRPEQVSYGSNKPIIWNGVCGHTWTATPKNRGNKHGCPYCSSNEILVGVNDLASRHPKLAKEWSEKNHPAMPIVLRQKEFQVFLVKQLLQWNRRYDDLLFYG